MTDSSNHRGSSTVVILIKLRAQAHYKQYYSPRSSAHCHSRTKTCITAMSGWLAHLSQRLMNSVLPASPRTESDFLEANKQPTSYSKLQLDKAEGFQNAVSSALPSLLNHKNEIITKLPPPKKDSSSFPPPHSHYLTLRLLHSLLTYNSQIEAHPSSLIPIKPRPGGFTPIEALSNPSQIL